MKIRIGTISGASGIGNSQTLDALATSGASLLPDETPILSADELLVLDQLTAALAAHAIDPSDKSKEQRVQPGVSIAAVRSQVQDIGGVAGIPGAITRVITVAVKNAGEAGTIFDDVIARTTAEAVGLAAMQAGATDIAITNTEALLLPATLQAIVDTRLQAFTEPAGASTTRVGDGHAGRDGSQSDGEPSGSPRQYPWSEPAAEPQKILVTNYQPPLFNRRLETNGVDDGLLLAMEFARQKTPAVGHPVVPPVQPGAPIVAMTPVVPDSFGLEIPARRHPDTDTPSARYPWPHIARWRALRSACLQRFPVPKPGRAVERRHRSCRNRQQMHSMSHASFMMSDPRSNGAAERVACWVSADRSRPGAMSLSRQPVCPQPFTGALHPFGIQRAASSLDYSVALPTLTYMARGCAVRVIRSSDAGS